jgi:hypothetical protein
MINRDDVLNSDYDNYDVLTLIDKVAVLEKENEWLFDFALGYTNAPFLTECLEGVRRESSK